MLDLSAGVLVGLGLAGSSFSLVIGAFGKLMPERWRMLSFGAGTAAGSFGQFLFSPLAAGIIKGAGWQTALIVFAGLVLMVLPLSFALATRGNAAKVGRRATAIRQAGADRGFRPSLFRIAGARLLHLRVPACVHHRCICRPI